MAVIRWNPWSLTDFLENDLSIPTIPGLSKLGQGLNLYETDDSIIAEAALPGIPEDQIDITIDNGVVRISGSMAESKEDRSKRKYYMSSMATSYNYSFRLPEEIVKDREPTAELSDGVLMLIFAKKEKIPPKKIKVKTKGKSAKIEVKKTK